MSVIGGLPSEVSDFLGGRVVLHAGDCLDVVRTLGAASIDAVVTDPPYALVSIGRRLSNPGAAPIQYGRDGLYQRASAGFMGKSWDTGERAFAVDFWAEVVRVLKPGGHVIAFSATRTYHRLACAIEDAGFEIRDQLQWLYSSGFPKSHDVSKAIDKAAGAERRVVAERYTVKRLKPGATVERDGAWGKQDVAYTATATAPATDDAARWQGWGTALKPACEPMVLARKPLVGSVAANVLAHGTGGINVDGCRIGDSGGTAGAGPGPALIGCPVPGLGRWPANVLHDGSDEVTGSFPGDGGSSAARFFYTAKADVHDRAGSMHPTVKPLDLMQWLCRLVTPPGGVVLDPFAGTGTTGEAAWREGFSAVLIEREAEYRTDIARRMALATTAAGPRKALSRVARHGAAEGHGPLFGGEAAPAVGGAG